MPEGPSFPVCSTFVQELFQAQYRYEAASPTACGLPRGCRGLDGGPTSLSSKVLPDVPSLPEAERHLRPLPLHLSANSSAPHQVSAAGCRVRLVPCGLPGARRSLPGRAAGPVTGPDGPRGR